MLPLQQPPGHDVASHTHWPLPLHSWPVAHAAQVAPPVPHDALDSEPYGSQVPVLPPLQQPLGHDVASHTQTPPRQRFPEGQAGPLPHVQVPLAHVSVVVGSHAAHVPPLAPHDDVDSDA